MLILTNHKTFVYTNELWRFANERPSMVDLELPGLIITADDAIVFIRQMKSLNRFCFKALDHTEYNRLKNELNDEWQFGNVPFVDHRCIISYCYIDS